MKGYFLEAQKGNKHKPLEFKKGGLYSGFGTKKEAEAVKKEILKQFPTPKGAKLNIKRL